MNKFKRVAATLGRDAKVEITHPTQGNGVTRIVAVEGRFEGEGWPVVFVGYYDAPWSPNQEWWWIENPVESLADGAFRIDVGVGDEKTPPGSRFQIVVVVAKSREEADKYIKWSDHESLPANLPRSKMIQVTRDK